MSRIGSESPARAAGDLARRFRVGRALAGLGLILHGLAHSPSGIVLVDSTRSWRLFDETILGTIMVSTSATLWAISMLGFITAGLGLLGIAALQRHGRRLVLTAAIASLLLLALAATTYAMAGAVIDIALLLLLGFTGRDVLRGQWIWHRTLLETAAFGPSRSQR